MVTKTHKALIANFGELPPSALAEEVLQQVYEGIWSAYYIARNPKELAEQLEIDGQPTDAPHAKIVISISLEPITPKNKE